MQLTIKDIKDADGGEYFCQAENSFGNASQAVSVRLRNMVNRALRFKICIFKYFQKTNRNLILF